MREVSNKAAVDTNNNNNATPGTTGSSGASKMRNEFLPQRSVSGLIPKLSTTPSSTNSKQNHHNLQVKSSLPKSNMSESAPDTPKSTLKVSLIN